MAQIVVRNIPEKTMDALRRVARRKGSSVEQEVRELIAAAVERAERRARFLRESARFRARLLDQGRPFTDSTALVREGRDA